MRSVTKSQIDTEKSAAILADFSFIDRVTEYLLRDLTPSRMTKLLYEAESALNAFRKDHRSDSPSFELLYDLHLMDLVFKDEPKSALAAVAVYLSRQTKTVSTFPCMSYIAQLLALDALNDLNSTPYRRERQATLRKKYGGKRGAARKMELSKPKMGARLQWTIDLINGGTTKHLRKLIAAKFNVSLRTAGEILKSAREVGS